VFCRKNPFWIVPTELRFTARLQLQTPKGWFAVVAVQTRLQWSFAVIRSATRADPREITANGNPFAVVVCSNNAIFLLWNDPNSLCFYWKIPFSFAFHN